MRRCPDCAVEMEAMEHTTTAHKREQLKIGTDGGLKARFGMDGMAVTAYVCPECRLVRLYAE